MIGVIVIGIVGIALLVIGYLIGEKEQITLLHDYHYVNVSEADKHAFCKLSGWGILSVGIGLVVTAVVMGITESLLSFLGFAAGLIAGLTLLIYAGKKYNTK